MSDNKTQSGMTPDASAAHELLSELRTRITTQRLPYQYGTEARALESLWEVFGQARSAMKKYPGCVAFAAMTTEMLNMDLRPVTAKWHRAFEDGRLNSHDGADEFRGDLMLVQETLQEFARKLQQMVIDGSPGAGVSPPPPDEQTPPAITDAQLDEDFRAIKFGIDQTPLVEPNTVNRINAVEADEVAARRANRKIGTDKAMNAIGLALSGGGIRSATFCLGVAQVLADRGFLKEVDYLSTVSGGGYIGGFIATRLDSLDVDENELGRARGPDSAAIRYVRRHAKYLPTLDLKQRLAMVTSTLAGMLLNWTAPLFAIVLTTLIGVLISTAYPERDNWPVVFGVFAGFSALALVAYGISVRIGARAARRVGTILGVGLAGTLISGIAWLLHVNWERINALVFDSPPIVWKTSAIVSAIVTAAPSIFKFFRVLQSPTARQITLKVVLALAGLVVPILAVAMFALAWKLGTTETCLAYSAWNPLHYTDGIYVLAIAACLLALISFGVLNINLTSPHRMYRNGIARTFISRSEKDELVKPLKDVNKTQRAPYHLVNATVNLPTSEDAGLRDRKCDFFLFSKHWCGSPSVGYSQTINWQANGANADLATAVAVSGAAASSYMGLGSIPSLVALLTLLNVRLGFWIRRPSKLPVATSAPGFMCLMREMTGFLMSEKRRWVNLSDGGHIENMAVYELLRRRCKFIICVDGEADPGFTFQGLMTLVRHAQLDFGVRIDAGLDQLRIDPNSHMSQTHFTLCRIFYPRAADGRPPATGLMLYMKLSVTGNESELIRRYRKLSPDFPHESTIDQFFSEEQFEAYRQLGVHVAEGTFLKTLMNQTDQSPAPPRDIPDWFRRLAGNLLTPP